MTENMEDKSDLPKEVPSEDSDDLVTSDAPDLLSMFEPAPKNPKIGDVRRPLQQPERGEPGAQTEQRNHPTEEEIQASMMSALGDKDKNEDDVVAAIRRLGITRDQVPSLLRANHRDSNFIAEVMTHAGEFAQELSAEDRDAMVNAPPLDVESTKTEIDEQMDLLEELELKSRDHEADEHDEKKVNKAQEKLKNLLFNEETGLLREGERVRRLLIKPGAVGLLATLIAYMALLSVMTKWASARVK